MARPLHHKLVSFLGYEMCHRKISNQTTRHQYYIIFYEEHPFNILISQRDLRQWVNHLPS